MLFVSRLVVASLLLLFFTIAALGNLTLALRSHFRKEHHSLIPFVGGIAGTIGALICPFPAVQSLWWLPLLADIGAVPTLIITLIWSAVRRWRRGPSQQP